MLAGCGARSGAGDDGGTDDADAGSDLGLTACDGVHPCAGGARCHLGFCIPDNGACAGDDDCQGDTYCDCPRPDGGSGRGHDGGAACGVCVPWGGPPRAAFDPTCRAPMFNLAEVVPPIIKCAATQAAVETTPLIADLDGDGTPEILYADLNTGIHAMHGDCTPVFDTEFALANWNASQLAVADLDGDGKPEIIGIDRTRRVAVFDNQGKYLASSPNAYDATGATTEMGGPAIVDLDNHAPPEILVGGQALQYTDKSKPALRELWQVVPEQPYWGSLTIACDLDGDHHPEVITGKQILHGTDGVDVTPPPLKALDGAGAFSAIADFNGDGKPDIAMVQSGQNTRRVLIYDFANQKFLLGPYDINDAFGGAPTVADFDGDGKPEMGVAGDRDYTVYDLKCAGQARPAKCDQTTLGVLWHRIIRDNSGVSSAAAFDLNGDSASEVVYRDECWLRVFDGKNGKTVFALPMPSSTSVDEPVVADIDGDGHAEIVVSASGDPMCDGKPDPDTGTKWNTTTLGVYVLSDPEKRWMPARPLWNQHSYHITNIKDDLSVPEIETPNWTVWNEYRANEQGISGLPAGIADLTARASAIPDRGPTDCNIKWTLYADICNRGGGTAPRGIKGAFYAVDPRTASPPPICTLQTTIWLIPGECQTLSCDWLTPPSPHANLWFRANDDGKSTPVQSECNPHNDVLSLPDQHCRQIQ